MTTLVAMSDLHFEFHKDGGARWVDALDLTSVDILALAGDIGTVPVLVPALRRLCDKVENVIFVCGNHEFWGSNRETVCSALETASAAAGNLHVLGSGFPREALVAGHRFVGCPLWFPRSEKAVAWEPDWADFLKISGFSSWVYDESEEDVAALKSKVTAESIVMTHYLPTYKSVAERFKNSGVNDFFVNDVEDTIHSSKPKLWIHGHTHDSFDYHIGPTRILCNPLGYKGLAENTRFKKKQVVTLS